MSEIENSDIELRSNEVREILNRPPKWILRYGIVLIFIVLVGLLVGSWFFRYPEILTAPIVVSTENLPFDIVAKTSKRIDTLMVAEKQRVNKNQLLGVLENSANTDDVLALESMLNDINISSPVSVYGRTWIIDNIVSASYSLLMPLSLKPTKILRFFCERIIKPRKSGQ